MADDGQRPAVGVLGELAGHGLELGLGTRGQVGGVGGEGDIAGQGDGDVIATDLGAGGVVQGPGVALDGDGFGELGGGARELIDSAAGGAQVDVGFLGGVGLQHRDGGEAGHRDEDSHLVGIDLAEGQIGGDFLTGGRVEESAAAVGGAPHAPALQVEKLDQVGAGAGTKDGWGPEVVRDAELVAVVAVGVGVDIVDGGVVLGSGQLQGHDRGGLVLADDRRDPHRHVVAHDVSIELLPVGAADPDSPAGGCGPAHRGRGARRRRIRRRRDVPALRHPGKHVAPGQHRHPDTHQKRQSHKRPTRWRRRGNAERTEECRGHRNSLVRTCSETECNHNVMVPSRDAPRALPIPPRGEPIGSGRLREEPRRLIFIEWLRALRQ